MAHSTVVVFPAPFGPRIPKISPWSTEKEMSSTAVSGPYVLRRCEISSADPSASFVWDAPAVDAAGSLSTVTAVAVTCSCRGPACSVRALLTPSSGIVAHSRGLSLAEWSGSRGAKWTHAASGPLPPDARSVAAAYVRAVRSSSIENSRSATRFGSTRYAPCSYSLVIHTLQVPSNDAVSIAIVRSTYSSSQ